MDFPDQKVKKYLTNKSQKAFSNYLKLLDDAAVDFQDQLSEKCFTKNRSKSLFQLFKIIRQWAQNFLIQIPKKLNKNSSIIIEYRLE